MNKITLPHIGKRTLKSAFAVLICLIFLPLISIDAPFYACIAAVLSMQSTPEGSVKYGITRLKSTLLGGIWALLFIFINQITNYQLYAVVVSLGIVAVIYSCNIVGWKEASGTGCVVYCSILINHAEEMYIFAFTRMLETALGVIIAVIINKYFFNGLIFKNKKFDINSEDEEK